MRPISITLENINSFREAQTVDFASLAGGGNMFCISGDTGSGKSTVFAAMLLALYKLQKGATLSDFINLSADKATVEFTFEADGKTYVSHRELYRSGSRGEKNFLKENGETVATGDGIFDRLREIIGLDLDQFTQVALLEQGKFDKFLESKEAERFNTLGRLLGLDRFRNLHAIANARMSGVRNDLDRIAERLNYFERDSLTKERLAEVKAERKTLAKEVKDLSARENALAERVKEESDRRKRHEEIVRLGKDLQTAKALWERSEATLAALAKECADPEKETEAAVRREQELKSVRENERRLRADLKKKNEELFAAREAYKITQAEVMRLERELAESLRGDLDGAVALILHHTSPGDRCPVCGGTIASHADADGSVSARAEKEKRYAEQKARLEQMAKDGKRCSEEVQALTARIAEEIAPFGDLEAAAKAAGERLGVLRGLTEQRKRAETVRAENRSKFETLSAELASKGADDYNEAKGKQTEKEYADVKREREAKTVRLSLDEKEQARIEAALEESAELVRQKKEREAKEKDLKQLVDLFKSNAFLEFVADEYIKDFTVNASAVMQRLSGGNYTLEYENRKFFIRDFLNGNKARGVNTLSGGETFLASLSLAISIMQYISAGKSFEFFFLDEGFGTLHEEAVETVVYALRELAKDVTVGIISHVDVLVDRIQSRIRIEHATEEHGSLVTVC